MVRRLTGLLCVLLLLCGVACADQRVFDEADLFTDSQEAAIQMKIELICRTYQTDVVVLTTRDVPTTYTDRVIQDYADCWYDENGFGVGDDHSGILYMIDMNNRAPVVSTCGNMIDYFTDDRLERLFDNSYDELADGRYAAAVESVLSDVDTYLNLGIPEGAYRYDAETGQRDAEQNNKLFKYAVGFGLLLIGGAMLW